MKKELILLLIIFLFSFIGFRQEVYSQDVLGQTVSTSEFLPNSMDLSSALKYSLENNNNIRAMKNGLSATERDIGITRSAMMPKLVVNENFMVTNNPIEAFSIKLNQTRATAGDLAFGTLDYPGATTNFLTSGVIEQKLFDRRALIAIKMAKKEYSANGYVYLRKQEEIANQVSQAFLKIIMEQELLEVAHQSLDAAQKHFEIAQEHYKNKTGTTADILRLKSAIDQKQEIIVLIQKNLDIAKRKLGLLLGLECSIGIIGTIPDIMLQDIDYYKSFSIYRNDIKAMEIRMENAKNNIKYEQAEFYPTLNAIASYNFYNRQYPFGGQGNNYIAGAYCRWELFDGNRRKYAVLKAKDKEAEIKEYLEGLRKTVSFSVYEVYSNVQAHQKNLELAMLALKAAEEDTQLVEKRWKASQIPFVALIDAQKNLNEARENVVKNRFDLKEDLLNLAFESGIIFQELGLK